MFIAHLPAGYVLARSLVKRLGISGTRRRTFVWAVLVGSVLPDFDMLYFYLIDNRQHGHHSYWTHIPAYWFAAMALMFFVSILFKWPKALALSFGVFVGCILHTLLDSVAGGGIQWGFPLNGDYFSLIHVESRYDWWVWNYVLHWSFAFEVMLMMWALFAYRNAHVAYRKSALPRFPEA